jgi:prepilin-type N-terminal cleavage/methylation domain-containing protein
MRVPPMTTSSIGNNSIPAKLPLKNLCQGFTFIEIMATLAILAGGVIMLYKSFFLCLDYQTHLAYRAHAHNILENKIALTEQMLRDYKILSFTHDIQQESVEFNGREVAFQVDIQVVPAGDATSLYQIEVSVSWKESNRDVTVKRAAYISSLTSIRNT